MLSDERRSHSKIIPQFIWIKEPCIRKFEGLACLKLLGISQTIMEVKTQEQVLKLFLACVVIISIQRNEQNIRFKD